MPHEHERRLRPPLTSPDPGPRQSARDFSFSSFLRPPLKRRQFLGLVGASAALTLSPISGIAATTDLVDSLLTVPVELVGAWGGSLPEAARQVILHMRAACLRGVRLLSDRQPARLRVEEHTSGPPSIWLHSDPLTTAWVIVDIGERDWSKLSYQFGHELGHVLANSWNVAAWPKPPCQWLEEAMVEAFSIRGLRRLAADWARDPPFPGDNAFSQAIARYRADIIARYGGVEGAAAPTDLVPWFAANRAEIELHGGIRDLLGPMVLAALEAYESDPDCVADLGALNRWPERTSLPLPDYFRKWQASCAQIKAPGALPLRLAARLGVA